MSDRALPIVFINLCGEMLYILQQRLVAQNISDEKSSRVMQDVISTMLNPKFIEELFSPQSMNSRSALQIVFEKLVHSSIMRLNSSSMAKLYDLMTMVFKHQVVNCFQAGDLFLVTLNHLDGIEDCGKSFPGVKAKVAHVHSLLMKIFKSMSLEDYEDLRKAVLIFLQDINIRVSVLLKLGYQLPDGNLVICDEAQIRRNGEEDRNNSSSSPEDDSGKFWLNGLLQRNVCGSRGTTLGTNIYIRPTATDMCTKLSEFVVNTHDEDEKNLSSAYEEINLLVRLIRNFKEEIASPEICLSSIENNIEEVFVRSTEKNCEVVTIDASKKAAQEDLYKLSEDLNIEEDATINKDILELLDIAEQSPRM